MMMMFVLCTWQVQSMNIMLKVHWENPIIIEKYAVPIICAYPSAATE